MKLKLKKRDKKVQLNVTIDEGLMNFLEMLKEKTGANLSNVTNDVVEYVKMAYEKGELVLEEDDQENKLQEDNHNK